MLYQPKLLQASDLDRIGCVVQAQQVAVMTEALRIAWIDDHRLTRDCMMSAFGSVHPMMLPAPFDTVEEYVGAVAPPAADLVVYYVHRLGFAVCEEVAALKQAVDQRPIVLLSDTIESEGLEIIRTALKSGANGYVCTRTSSLSMALAAILFVQAGGTFAPVELLLSEETVPSTQREQAPSERLTTRQMNVLAQVRQGKANKAIARALGMSESAVKVHIRSIMRKMGAANRTQAAFAAIDRLGDEDGLGKAAAPPAILPPPGMVDEQNEGRDA